MRYVSTIAILGICIVTTTGYSKVNPAIIIPSKLDYGPATTVGIVTNQELIELSGIVSGGVNKNLLWVHNDRHNLPRLYALNNRGETVLTCCLDTFNESGTMLGDWEDIARMPGTEEGCYDLYVGDIGNNPMTKRVHNILVVSEPSVDAEIFSQITDTNFKTIRFRYPDSYICNSECLLVHPVTKEIFVVSKLVKYENEKIDGILVWSIPVGNDYEKIQTARLVTDSIPNIEKLEVPVTGGDISSDGQYLILKAKEKGYLWRLKKGIPLKETLLGKPKLIALSEEYGGEAICFSFDKSKLFTVYDGKKENRPLHVYLEK